MKNFSLIFCLLSIIKGSVLVFAVEPPETEGEGALRIQRFWRGICAKDRELDLWQKDTAKRHPIATLQAIAAMKQRQLEKHEKHIVVMQELFSQKSPGIEHLEKLGQEASAAAQTVKLSEKARKTYLKKARGKIADFPYIKREFTCLMMQFWSLEKELSRWDFLIQHKSAVCIQSFVNTIKALNERELKKAGDSAESFCNWKALKKHFLAVRFGGEKVKVFIIAKGPAYNEFRDELSKQLDRIGVNCPSSHDMPIPLFANYLPGIARFLLPICWKFSNNDGWSGCLILSAKNTAQRHISPFIRYTKKADGDIVPHIFFQGKWIGAFDSLLPDRKNAPPSNIETFSADSLAHAVVDAIGGRKEFDTILSEYAIDRYALSWAYWFALREMGVILSLEVSKRPSIEELSYTSAKAFLPIVLTLLGVLKSAAPSE